MAGVAGRVAAFGEPLVMVDYNSWAGRLNPEKEAPYRAVAGVPLKFQGQVIGTLSVMDNRTDKVFRPEDVQLLELLAPQVTVWIRNARLYQELQDRIEAQRLAESHLVRSARLAAIGEMAAGVAHELNNPLTTVIGFAELVLGELPEGSPLRVDLELVLRESQRARQVVRGLLDFSRPVENLRMRVNINDLVNDVLNLVNHLLNTGDIEANIDLYDHLPWISVDPSQIKQVLLNLVHNAIQAMPDGGTLGVRTSQLDLDGREWLTIAVRDTGVGIPIEYMDRIFEPFFTTRPAGQGTGLGLSVSYGIVTEHEGFIDVQSQPGQGSSFTVYLPMEITRDKEVVATHA
jgi:two-component system NtrC family sensor kinase